MQSLVNVAEPTYEKIKSIDSYYKHLTIGVFFMPSSIKYDD